MSVFFQGLVLALVLLLQVFWAALVIFLWRLWRRSFREARHLRRVLRLNAENDNYR